MEYQHPSSLPDAEGVEEKMKCSAANLFLFISDGTMILLPHPGTKVAVDEVTF